VFSYTAEGYLTPSPELLQLLTVIPEIVNGSSDPSLQGGVVWIDRNHNLIQDDQESSNSIAYGGRIRVALSSDSIGSDLLVAHGPNTSTSDQRVLLSTINRPNFSTDNTVDILLGKAGQQNSLFGPIQVGDKLSWNGTGIILSQATTSNKFVQFNVNGADWLANTNRKLLFYRTDEQHRVLSADGLHVADSLEQAVVAQIGAVRDDLGRALYSPGSIDVRLNLGQELRVMLLDGISSTLIPSSLQVVSDGKGLVLSLASSPLVIRADLIEASSVDLQLDLAQSSGISELLFFQAHDIIDLQFLSSCANTNTVVFVKVDVNLDNQSGTSQLSVAGMPFNNTDAFRQHLLLHREPDFRVTQGGGGTKSSSHAWAVSSTGYYTLVMITQNGDVFTLGSQYNRDGRLHLKSLGDGAYAFEDLAADQGSDFDFNDGVLVIKRRSSSAPMDLPNLPSRASALDRNVAPAVVSPRTVPTSLANSNALVRATIPAQQDIQALQIEPLNRQVAGLSPQAPSFAAIRYGDALTMWDRGELRVAVPSQGRDPATLLSWQSDLLTAVTTSLGKAKLPLPLALIPYASVSEAQEQLSTGQVDLVLVDDNDSLWLDGLAGLNSFKLIHPNPAVLLVTQMSGINSFDDLAGSKLGVTSGARISTSLAQTLSRHDSTATIHHFSDLQQAREALRLGQLDGLVLMQASAPAVQEWLKNNGIDSQVLLAPD
jgi:ABC-type amino acid transport substrate-binding protein